MDVIWTVHVRYPVAIPWQRRIRTDKLRIKRLYYVCIASELRMHCGCKRKLIRTQSFGHAQNFGCGKNGVCGCLRMPTKDAVYITSEKRIENNISRILRTIYVKFRKNEIFVRYSSCIRYFGLCDRAFRIELQALAHTLTIFSFLQARIHFRISCLLRP